MWNIACFVLNDDDDDDSNAGDDGGGGGRNCACGCDDGGYDCDGGRKGFEKGGCDGCKGYGGDVDNVGSDDDNSVCDDDRGDGHDCHDGDGYF